MLAASIIMYNESVLEKKPYIYLKRVIDIIGSLFGIIFFSPFIIAASIWIKVVSPEGPIMADIPPRVGKDKKKFTLHKFRSMIPHAHEYLIAHPDLYKKYVENSYKLVAEEDPRIIKGGIFMRKYSIDEMPQVFNILKGEMSLVGPRAYYFFEIDEQVKRHPEVKEMLEEVLTAKPGLTGLWQVSGRSDVGFVDRVRLDHEYVKRRGFWYDLMIICKTPFVVLFRKGAI